MNADVVAIIKEGDLAGLKRLVASGHVPVNGNRDLGPLHLAAFCGHLDMVRYLVEEAGADPRMRNSCRCAPLDLASSVEIARYLIEERGMDPTDTNSDVGRKGFADDWQV